MEQNKKNIFFWALYDFANSPLNTAIGGLYLGQWLILDKGIEEIWYGAIFSITTILLLLTAPFWGSWSDQIGKRMPFIKWITILLIISALALAIFANAPLASFQIPLIFIIFFFIQYLYQLSLVFYDSLIRKMANNGNIGKISGIGEALNELGWIIGPAILLPFATGSITVFGTPGRSQTFFPAALLLIVFCIPMLIWFKEKASEPALRTDYKSVLKTAYKGLKELIAKDRNALRFLIACCVIFDSMLTVELYFGVFLDQIYGISDTQKFYALAIMIIFATPTSYFSGKLIDKFGAKKILIASCFLLCPAIILIAFSKNLTLLYAMAGLTGIGWGGIYTSARTFLIKIAPEKRLGEYFGFYATFQRFASIIGPLAYGLIVLFLKNLGNFRYVVAFSSLAILILIGGLILFKVKEERTIN